MQMVQVAAIVEANAGISWGDHANIGTGYYGLGFHRLSRRLIDVPQETRFSKPRGKCEERGNYCKVVPAPGPAGPAYTPLANP